MRLTTLCYIEKDGSYLMMHRIKKEQDENAGKWIGIGGHLKEDETPEECVRREILEHIWVYDDGIVKGLIHIEKEEIVELYVDYFFQNQQIGSALLEYAIKEHRCTYLWAIEKNIDAIRFYERHGFHLSQEKKFEEGIIDDNSLVYATHISHEGNDIHDKMEELSTNYGYHIAYDGMKLEI